MNLETELANIIETISCFQGDDFFKKMTELLGQTVKSDYCFIARVDKSLTTAETISVYARGDSIDNFTYDLAQMPCAETACKEFNIYLSGVADQFPDHLMLKEMAIEGYMAQPLKNKQGELFAIVVALYHKAIQEVEPKQLLFRIFSNWIAAEIQRSENEKIHQQREHLLRTQARIIDQIHDSVVSTDLDGFVTSWNKGAERQFGYSSEEMLGQPIALIYPPEDHEFLQHEIIATLKQKGNHDVEVTIRRKSGEDFVAHLSLSMLHDECDKPIGMIGYTIDINERILAEKALRDSETQLRTVIETLPDLVWLKDPQGVYITCNHQFERLFGARESEIVGRTDYDFVNKELADFFREKDNHAMAIGKPSINEEEVTYADDGHIEQLETIKTPMFDQKGKITGVLGIARNITERKQLEAKLKEEFEVYQTAMNSTALGFWVVNTQGQILETNEAYLRLSGYSSEECLKLSVFDLEAGLTHDEILEYSNAIMKTRTGCFRTKHYRKDGSVWPVEVNSSFSEIRGGRFFVFLEDITEKDKSEQKLEHYRNHLEELVKERTHELEGARDEAEKANQAKSDFLSSMSHELRTPLNAIIGFSQLMMINNSLSDANKDNVKEILNAGHHLLELINEVLDLSRIESGHINLSIEAVEISPIIEECLTLMRTLAEIRGIRITHSGVAGVVVQADSTRLKQVLLNLLSNAVKYNSNGGRVTMRSQVTDNQRLRIAISDTGPGIPNESLDKLFQPFHRLGAENSGIEGTGMGLTLSKNIVQLMGGDIHVESEIGVGSTFWFELPIASIKPVPDLQNNDKKGTGIADVTNQGQRTILYVEDNPSNIRLVEQILLRRKNINLITAHTPELGIEMAKTSKPDVILLDINLPGMNGYQVLEILKDMEQFKNTPVVAITANAMTSDIERGKAAGFVEYLTKPLNIQNFNKTMDELLESED